MGLDLIDYNNLGLDDLISNMPMVFDYVKNTKVHYFEVIWSIYSRLTLLWRLSNKIQEFNYTFKPSRIGKHSTFQPCAHNGFVKLLRARCIHLITKRLLSYLIDLLGESRNEDIWEWVKPLADWGVSTLSAAMKQ